VNRFSLFLSYSLCADGEIVAQTEVLGAPDLNRVDWTVLAKAPLLYLPSMDDQAIEHSLTPLFSAFCAGAPRICAAVAGAISQAQETASISLSAEYHVQGRRGVGPVPPSNIWINVSKYYQSPDGAQERILAAACFEEGAWHDTDPQESLGAEDGLREDIETALATLRGAVPA
jgi:hypothetical protein